MIFKIKFLSKNLSIEKKNFTIITSVIYSVDMFKE